MKAAVLYEFGQPLSIQNVELDSPKTGEIRVKIGAAGICRSDLHFMNGHAAAQLPIVLGHEGAGTVLEVGEGVTSVKPSDRVILSSQLRPLPLLPDRARQLVRCPRNHHWIHVRWHNQTASR